MWEGLFDAMPRTRDLQVPNGALGWIKVVGEFIRDIGFPIFVAVWLLWQVAPAIAENTSTQQSVAHHLAQLVEQQRELLGELRRERRP